MRATEYLLCVFVFALLSLYTSSIHTDPANTGIAGPIGDFGLSNDGRNDLEKRRARAGMGTVASDTRIQYTC